MAKPGTTHVIEIETGIGEPAFIPLTVGQELQPISVGKKGMWRIESARVLDVHAFVYFDGTSLFVQSADEAQAASVEGYRVGKAWTELHAPCKIEIGAARLRFRSLSDPLPEAPKPPPPTPDPPRPTARGPQPVADLGETLPPPGESQTRVGDPQQQAPRQVNPTTPERSMRNMTGPIMPGVQAIPVSQHPPGLMNNAIMSSGAHNLPPQGMPPMTQPMAALPHQGMPHMPPMMQQPIPSNTVGTFGAMNTGLPGMTNRGAPTVQTKDQTMGGGGAGGVDMLLAKYRELNTPRRLLVIMAPFCLVASAYLLLFDDDQAPPQDTSAMDAGSPMFGNNNPGPRCPPGFVPYSVPVNGQVPCVPLGTPMPGQQPQPMPQPMPQPFPQPAPLPVPVDAGRGATVAATAVEPPPAVAMKTLERQAVDAVAVNDYPRAAAIYEQLLAQSNPKNPVYAEAARILRQKADAGVPPQ